MFGPDLIVPHALGEVADLEEVQIGAPLGQRALRVGKEDAGEPVELPTVPQLTGAN